MISEITISEAEGNMKAVLNAVAKDNSIKITMQDGHAVYMLSEEEYSSLVETCYLMKSPANTEHLMKAIGEKTVSFSSIEELKHETGF